MENQPTGNILWYHPACVPEHPSPEPLVSSKHVAPGASHYICIFHWASKTLGASGNLFVFWTATDLSQLLILAPKTKPWKSALFKSFFLFLCLRWKSGGNGKRKANQEHKIKCIYLLHISKNRFHIFISYIKEYEKHSSWYSLEIISQSRRKGLGLPSWPVVLHSKTSSNCFSVC